jgi:hypothetical protein
MIDPSISVPGVRVFVKEIVETCHLKIKSGLNLNDLQLKKELLRSYTKRSIFHKHVPR